MLFLERPATWTMRRSGSDRAARAFPTVSKYRCQIDSPWHEGVVPTSPRLCFGDLLFSLSLSLDVSPDLSWFISVPLFVFLFFSLSLSLFLCLYLLLLFLPLSVPLSLARLFSLTLLFSPLFLSLRTVPRLVLKAYNTHVDI